MREPPLLRVEWVDCVLLYNRWQDGDEMRTTETPIVSVGFRVKEEGGFLFLASSWQADDEHRHFAQAIAIPIRAIVKKRRIGH